MAIEILTTIIGAIIAFVGIIAGAILNHFLERSRSKQSLILNKKIDVYSSLLVKLNTVFQDDDKNFITDPNFKKTIHTTLSKALSQARLIAGKRLESKLRDYYDEAILFWEDKKDGDMMTILVIEIEGLMREELGGKKLH